MWPGCRRRGRSRAAAERRPRRSGTPALRHRRTAPRRRRRRHRPSRRRTARPGTAAARGLPGRCGRASCRTPARPRRRPASNPPCRAGAGSCRRWCAARRCRRSGWGAPGPRLNRRVSAADDRGREVLPDQVGDVCEWDEPRVLAQLRGGPVDVVGIERRELEADPVQVVAHQRLQARRPEVLAGQARDRVVTGLSPEGLRLRVVVDHEADVEQPQDVGQARGEREVEAASRGRADEILPTPLQGDRQELDRSVIGGLAEVPDAA